MSNTISFIASSVESSAIRAYDEQINLLYIDNRCTKSPTTCYGGYSSTFEMVLCMQHSLLAHVLTIVKTP
jgi:hypothetical protein